VSQANPNQHEIDVYCGEWILNGGDQSKAWRVAYPNSKQADDGVWVAACNMHKNPKVRLRLVEMQAEIAEKDAKEFDMSVSKLKETLSKVMVAGLEKDDSGKYNGLGATTGAVAEFNRMCGNHAATKQEITGKDGGAIETADMSERELARRIAFALAKGARK
jgi:hypothetical protein